MLYYLYEWNHAALAPFRAVADATKLFYQNPLNPISATQAGRTVAAMAELFERTTRVYGKPEFGLNDTLVGGQRVPVADKPVWEKPFARLLHFERALPASHKADPRFLIVAPMSGHYATLLRGTVEALLPYGEIYITDWTDARQVPVAAGRFDLDDYVDYLIEMLQFLGPDTHVIGVCQPAVPVLMAVARMEADQDPCSPSTMTLMGGPIDTRINPTAVNKLAEERGIDWFRDNVIMKVPFPQPGFMRDVYPGFLQLTGFMSMNLDRHMLAHKEFFWNLVKNDGDPAEKHREFYDEYLAVMDMTAEFYLQTVKSVFIDHALPKGEMMHRGHRIDLSAIKRTALLTIEGENDDISGVGQTEAAHRLCSSIPEEKRVHYVQPKVGHYGVFNGSRYRSEIAPRIVDFALTHGTTHASASLPRKTEVSDPKAPTRQGAVKERDAKARQLSVEGAALSAAVKAEEAGAPASPVVDMANEAVTAGATTLSSAAAPMPEAQAPAAPAAAAAEPFGAEASAPAGETQVEPAASSATAADQPQASVPAASVAPETAPAAPTAEAKSGEKTAAKLDPAEMPAAASAPQPKPARKPAPASRKPSTGNEVLRRKPAGGLAAKLAAAVPQPADAELRAKPPLAAAAANGAAALAGPVSDAAAMPAAADVPLDALLPSVRADGHPARKPAKPSPHEQRLAKRRTADAEKKARLKRGKRDAS